MSSPLKNLPAHCQNCPFLLLMVEACPSTPSSSFSPSSSILFPLLSLAPYLLGLFIGVQFIRLRTTRFLCLFFLLIVQNALIEVAKNTMDEQRPEGACARTGAMPSSHSATWVAFVVWITLEKLSFFRGWNWLVIIGSWILLPLILISRVSLNYHTWEHVVAGCVIGAADAFFLFLFVKNAVDTVEIQKYIGPLPIMYDVFDWMMVKVDFHKEQFFVKQIRPKKTKANSQKILELTKTYNEVHKLKENLQKQKEILQSKVQTMTNLMNHAANTANESSKTQNDSQTTPSQGKAENQTKTSSQKGTNEKNQENSQRRVGLPTKITSFY